MKKTRSSKVSALTAAIITSTAYGVDLTWVGASGSNWSVPSSWNPAQAPVAADNADFSGISGPTTANLVGDTSITNLTLSSNVTNTLTLSGTGGFSVTGQISGLAGITLNNVGNSTFRTGNTYDGTTTVGSGSTLLLLGGNGVGDAGENTSLGSTVGETVVQNGGRIEFSAVGSNWGSSTRQINEPLKIEGSGVGGNGVLDRIDNTGDTTVEVRNLTLTGDATITATNRWEVRGGGSVLDLTNGGSNSGYTLTRRGFSHFGISGGQINWGTTGTIVAEQGGTFAIEGGANIDSTGTVTMNPGTNLLFWGSTNTKEGTINLNGARIENARDVVNNTLNGPLNINGGGNEINVFFNTNPNEGALGDQTLLVSGILGGSGTFNKTGEGTLVLSNNANTFSGTMNINQGTVRIDSASAIPAAAAVRVVSGATLRLGVDAQLNNIRSGGTVALQDDFGTPRNLTVAGTTTSVLAGLVGGGSLIKSGTGTLVLTGSNAHTGGITVNSGTVEVASDSALGGNTVAVQSGSTIAFSNAGLLEYTDSLAAAEAGNDAFVPPAPTGTATAVRDISGGDRNSVPENTRYYYSGKLTNPSAAPVTYTFAEQYDDDVFIRIGQQSGVDLAVPLINNNTWNAATQGQVTLAPGESQDVVIAMRNGVFGAGASSDGTGTNVDPDWFIYGIGFRTDIPEGGVIPAAQAGYSPVSVDNGLAFSTGQNRTINNAFVLNGSATMTTATMNGGAKATITGVISGSGSLVKAGAGELELNAANTFTGGAQVDAGTLHVVASASLASGVTVNSGGTLMGSGTIDGNVVVNSGGFLTPGASPGALTLVNDDLSLLNGSTTVFEVGGIITSLYDRILGINQITLDGNIQVTLFGGFTPSNGNSFDLFDATTVNSVGFNLATELQLPVLGDGLSWDTGQFLSQGILTVVPEPTSGAALTLGSAVFLGWRRRRQS